MADWDYYGDDYEGEYKEPKRTTPKQMHVLRKYGNLSEWELKRMSKSEKQEKVTELMEEYRAELYGDDYDY